MTRTDTTVDLSQKTPRIEAKHNWPKRKKNNKKIIEDFAIEFLSPKLRKLMKEQEEELWEPERSRRLREHVPWDQLSRPHGSSPRLKRQSQSEPKLCI